MPSLLVNPVILTSYVDAETVETLFTVPSPEAVPDKLKSEVSIFWTPSEKVTLKSTVSALVYSEDGVCRAMESIVGAITS